MNKYQEAINYLWKSYDENKIYGIASRGYIEMLQELVDKAIPIKFVKSYSKYGTESWLCPSCRRKLKKEWQHNNNYCPKCGQKIEWSD